MISLRDREGLTLLEILIAVAIFASLIFVIGTFIRGTQNFEDLVDQKLQVRQDFEQTFQLMVTEIRSMGPSSAGGYPIESAETSSLVFYSDLEGDVLFERMHYFLSTSTFNRGVTEPSGNPIVYDSLGETVTVAIEKVVTSTPAIFEYYGENYTGTESPLPPPINTQDIRVIKITVYADLTPRAPKPIFFSNTIDLRNLRSN